MENNFSVNIVDDFHNSIEIFAGGGGLALGVANAGFKHSYMVEWDKDSAQTLKLNNLKFDQNHIGEKFLFNGDIHQVNFKDYEGKIELLSGGPPCQPFSIGGKSKAYNDKRDLFSEATRTLSEIKPKAFMFENVRGLLRKNFSKYFGYIILQLTYPFIAKKGNEQWSEHLARLEKYHTSIHTEDLKYNVLFHLVNAADYGIPQKRERVFIIGFRSDVSANYSFPEPTHSKEALDFAKYGSGEYWEKHNLKKQTNKDYIASPVKDFDKKPWVTVRDALEDLPNPKQKNSIPNHIYQGGAKIYPGHTGSTLDEPSKTIKAGTHGVPGGENMLIDDRGKARYYTVREAARIQTFPDDYIFPCSWTESMRQIGNAVPVKLGGIVAKSVYETLEMEKTNNAV